MLLLTVLKPPRPLCLQVVFSPLFHGLQCKLGGFFHTVRQQAEPAARLGRQAGALGTSALGQVMLVLPACLGWAQSILSAGCAAW